PTGSRLPSRKCWTKVSAPPTSSKKAARPSPPPRWARPSWPLWTAETCKPIFRRNEKIGGGNHDADACLDRSFRRFFRRLSLRAGARRDPSARTRRDARARQCRRHARADARGEGRERSAQGLQEQDLRYLGDKKSARRR